MIPPIKTAMRIRIQGDGPPRSWLITNAETGEPILVTDLLIHITPQSSEITLKVRRVSVDVTADATVEEEPR